MRVEKDLSSLKGNQGNDKPSSSRAPVKTHSDRRDQDSFDIEGLQRMVKQLSNEIIDLKNTSGESTSGRGFFRFPDKKHFPPKQHPPPENINIQDYVMDKFCWEHKHNHSEKDCPAFINMFELFTTSKTNPPPFGEDENIENDRNPANELSINHFWDLCNLFKGEEEPNIEEIQTAQLTHNTRSKGPVAQTNPSPYIMNNTNDTPKGLRRKNMPDKEVTTNTTINKKNPPVNTTTSIELDFSIVEDLKRTRARISLFKLAKIAQFRNEIVNALPGKMTRIPQQLITNIYI